MQSASLIAGEERVEVDDRPEERLEDEKGPGLEEEVSDFEAETEEESKDEEEQPDLGEGSGPKEGQSDFEAELAEGPKDEEGSLLEE